MEYEQIKYELENSAVLKLLRSRNAALVLSFLHRQFKVIQQISIAQIELETRLDRTDKISNASPVFSKLF